MEVGLMDRNDDVSTDENVLTSNICDDALERAAGPADGKALELFHLQLLPVRTYRKSHLGRRRSTACGDARFGRDSFVGVVEPEESDEEPAPTTLSCQHIAMVTTKIAQLSAAAAVRADFAGSGR